MHRARINDASGMVAKLMATAYDPGVWSVEMLVEEGDFWFACQQYRVSTAFHGRARVMWEGASHGDAAPTYQAEADTGSGERTA